MSGNLYPAPEHPGWQEWRVGAPDQYNRTVLGSLLVRLDSSEIARIRLIPKRLHSNVSDAIHGGAILSLIDSAMFAGTTLLTGKDQAESVTVDLQAQFLSPGKLSQPLDVLVEVLRETGRMIYTRGVLVQEDDRVAAFTGLLRKRG